jgi:hypothetical protein
MSNQPPSGSSNAAQSSHAAAHDPTDDELREACAKALGWQHLGAVGVSLTREELKAMRTSEIDATYPGKLWCLSGQNDWWIDPTGATVCGPCQGIPDPLTNDADAMALVERLRLSVGFNSGWGCVKLDDRGMLLSGSYHYATLRRAIAVCAAMWQRSKDAAAAGEGTEPLSTQEAPAK